MTSAISAEQATQKAATDAVVEAKEITHDARAAAIASRILFLADGCIAKELKDADQGEIIPAVDAVSWQ
jgi:hypothetical protein